MLCRGARAMLGWSRTVLSKNADVAERTLVDFERGARQPHRRTLADIQEALEEGGAVFLDADETGPGMRIKGQPNRD